MATHVFRGGALYLGEYDFSSLTRSFAFDIEAEAVDMTVISSTTRTNSGGLRSVTWNADLLYDATTYEGSLYGYASATGGTEAIIASYFPSGAAAEDEMAYFLRSRPGKVSLPWTLGEAAMMSISGDSGALGGTRPAQSLVQGRLSARGAGVSATGNGTGRQMGALTSSKQLMAMAGHVTARTGTAAVVFTLESDDNSGFTSPTTRITESSISSVADFGVRTIAGAITDDYWRIKYTVTGTGTLSFVASMGRIILQ